MIETSSDLHRSSSAIFDNLRRMFGQRWEIGIQKFWKTLGNVRKVVGNLRKIATNIVVWILYYEKKITWSLGDTKFTFSCWKIFSALEDKFRIPRNHIISFISTHGRVDIIKSRVQFISCKISVEFNYELLFLKFRICEHNSEKFKPHFKPLTFTCTKQRCLLLSILTAKFAYIFINSKKQQFYKTVEAFSKINSLDVTKTITVRDLVLLNWVSPTCI